MPDQNTFPYHFKKVLHISGILKINNPFQQGEETACPTSTACTKLPFSLPCFTALYYHLQGIYYGKLLERLQHIFFIESTSKSNTEEAHYIT